MAGVAVFTTATLVCGLARAPAALLVARAVQGVGAAIMTPTALSIVSRTFPEGPERNKALGIWGSLGGLGVTAGWLIGGPLVDGPAGGGSFFVNIPADEGAAAPAVVARTSPRRFVAAAHVGEPAGGDRRAAVLFTLAAAARLQAALGRYTAKELEIISRFLRHSIELTNAGLERIRPRSRAE